MTQIGKQDGRQKRYDIKTLWNRNSDQTIDTQLILMRSNLKTLIFLVTQMKWPL